jgi:hypothetical protein
LKNKFWNEANSFFFVFFIFKKKKKKMPLALLALVYGPNTYPAWNFATEYFAKDVTVMHFVENSSVEQNNWQLQQWKNECQTSILLVCNCPLGLSVPHRSEVNIEDTGKRPSVRHFACAQSNECLPGQGQIPPQCELLLCDSLSGKLSPDSQRHLHAIFQAAMQQLPPLQQFFLLLQEE